jgi:hypothetical protein
VLRQAGLARDQRARIERANPTHRIPTPNVRSVDFVNSTVTPTTAVRMAIAPRLARLLIVLALAGARGSFVVTRSVDFTDPFTATSMVGQLTEH